MDITTARLAPLHGLTTTEAGDDVAYLRTAIVNLFFLGTPHAGDRGWILVDAGVKGSAGTIRSAAAARFGADARPSAIVLTHGHFDHVGALEELAQEWDVPVYAHELELPYITGESAYPPPDPAVGGGVMANLSWAFPRQPCDVGARARPLPADGTVPGAPAWRWIPSPGHSPGHVSLFRGADRFLIAGDAVITVRQESLFAVAVQRPELHGPPMYYTQDWWAAARSVRRLALLNPATLIPGHGVPLEGAAVSHALQELARTFERVAVPERGRYVREPAVADEHGTVWVPPRRGLPGPVRTMALVAGVIGGVLVARALLRGASNRRTREYDH